jgi:phage gpG-like protein
MADEVTIDTRKLNKFLKALKGPAPRIRIGILGDNNARSSSAATNAEIGAKHEFGIGVPQRSFLRKPLIEQFQKYLEESSFYNLQAFETVVREASLMGWTTKTAILAETIVLDAFATGGFGQWKAHAPGYTNNTGMILVDTQQLRNSISYEIKE